MKNLLLIITSALIGGCVTTQSQLDRSSASWIGYDKETIIQEWGEPTTKKSTVFHYVLIKEITAMDSVMQYDPNSHPCTIDFYFDQLGIVTVSKVGIYYCANLIKTAPDTSDEFKANIALELNNKRLAAYEKKKQLEADIKKKQLADKKKKRIEHGQSLKLAHAAIDNIKLSNTSPWRVGAYLSEMDRVPTAYAIGPSIKPRYQLDPPYAGVEAELAIYCNHSGYTEVRAKFNIAPNLIGGDFVYNTTKKNWNTRFRFDKTVYDGTITQSSGSKNISLAMPYNKIIDKVRGSSKFTFYLNWYGDGSYIDFPLKGSSAALDQILKVCNPLDL